jgi:hypothetical protein
MNCLLLLSNPIGCDVPLPLAIVEELPVLHFQTLLAAGGARFDVAYLVEVCAGWLGHNGSPFSSLLEVLVHELDGHGALTDGRGDALD